jgi:DNA-directed RNA polymerase subunit RPC12/RpoP
MQLSFSEVMPKPPRNRPRVMMHVIDAGVMEGNICIYKCKQCGRETDWLEYETVTQARRGIPCPDCNKD